MRRGLFGVVRGKGVESVERRGRGLGSGAGGMCSCFEGRAWEEGVAGREGGVGLVGGVEGPRGGGAFGGVSAVREEGWWRRGLWHWVLGSLGLAIFAILN